MKEYIEQRILPRIQGDGGWLDLLSEEGDVLTVQLQGECSKCHVADRCMDWIRSEIKRDLGRDVTIRYRRKKTFSGMSSNHDGRKKEPWHLFRLCAAACVPKSTPIFGSTG